MSLYSYGKRALDIVGALASLPVLAIATIGIVPLMKVTDPGPIFYAGERRGKDGKHFTIYKFRSMSVNAPDFRNSDFSTVTTASDPRVTPLGRVLRAASLDELPQVLNVLKGEMSFVGPRPNMTSQSWADLTPLERKRLTVRPGITGLAQALHRNGASTQEKYEIDAKYVDNLSFWLDLRIFLMTFVTVATSKNVNSPAPEVI